MSYNKSSYDRRKKGELLRGNEENEAFQLIKDKWDLTDRQINKYLRDYTVTEILEGEFDERGFTPGQRLSIKGAIMITILLTLIVGYKTYATEPVMVFTPNDHITCDN